jgi:putative ABC transport system permease protein
MEIRPILQTMRRAKLRVALIVVQVAVTLAILTNAVGIVNVYQSRLHRDTGIDTTSLTSVTSRPFDSSTRAGYVEDTVVRDSAALGAIPGVTHVSHAVWLPLSGDGPPRRSRPAGVDATLATTHSLYLGDEAFVDTLGLELVAGRNFDASEVQWYDDALAADRPPVVIVSQALADVLFPGGNALGQQIAIGENRLETIIGIVRQLPGRHVLMNALELSAVVPGRSTRTARYLVAIDTASNSSDEVIAAIERTLYDADRNREVTVNLLETLKVESGHFLFLFGTILSGVSVLLLIVTAVGSFSQTSYSVTRRVKEIGTRRAFGAGRLHLLRYFLLENWLMTTGGLIVGLLLANAVSFLLAVTLQTPRLSLADIVIGGVFLWITGLLATMAPALRASAIEPAIATRTS